MEKSRFFNSISTDTRTYTSQDFAEFIKTFYSNGVLNGGSKLQVTKGDALSVNVSSGMAMIQGYWYNNTDTLTLQVSAADTALPRIDRVILRLDLTLDVRAIRLMVLSGTPAISPQPPALTRDENIYDLSLAQFSMDVNATGISKVTDERIMTHAEYSVDLTEFEQQFTDKLTNFQTNGDEAIAQILASSDDAFLSKVQAVDGPDSGVNADMVDGKQASDLQNYNNLTNKPTINRIYSGTTDPASTTGENGDIYVKYNS